MEYRLTTLEKAFELARSGNCLTLTYLLKRLKAEGYDGMQIQGKALRKQLSELIERNRSS
jgi:hypothetical protein